MHLSAGQIPSTVQNRVAAVVVFGDPDNGQGFPGVLNGRSITFCSIMTSFVKEVISFYQRISAMAQ